jgi:hypothetical protein
MHTSSSKVEPDAEQEAVPRSQTGRTKLNPAKLNGSTRPTDERPRVTQRQAVCTQTPRKSGQVQSKEQYQGRRLGTQSSILPSSTVPLVQRMRGQGRRLGAQSSIQPNSTVPLVQRMRGPGLRGNKQYAHKLLESRARCRARSSTKVADWAHKAQSSQTQRFHSSNG